MIQIFTKENCAACKIILKALFGSKKKFIEKSLDTEESLVQLVTEGAIIKSVPILKIDNEFIYDIEQMKERIK